MQITWKSQAEFRKSLAEQKASLYWNISAFHLRSEKKNFLNPIVQTAFLSVNVVRFICEAKKRIYNAAKQITVNVFCNKRWFCGPVALLIICPRLFLFPYICTRDWFPCFKHGIKREAGEIPALSP